MYLRIDVCACVCVCVCARVDERQRLRPLGPTAPACLRHLRLRRQLRCAEPPICVVALPLRFPASKPPRLASALCVLVPPL